MAFSYNAEGIEINPKIKPIPEGEYALEIVKVQESKTKKDGYPCVIVEFRVIDNVSLNGKKIPFHYVTFFPKENRGAGISIHFLKTIGEPYEKDFVVEPYKWIGKRIKAHVVIEKGRDGKSEFNKVKWVNKYEGNQPKHDGERMPF